MLAGVGVVAVALLLPSGSWPRIALWVIAGVPALAAWLALPVWFLAVGRDFARQGQTVVDLAPSRPSALQVVRRRASWLHLLLALAVAAGASRRST